MPAPPGPDWHESHPDHPRKRTMPPSNIATRSHIERPPSMSWVTTTEVVSKITRKSHNEPLDRSCVDRIEACRRLVPQGESLGALRWLWRSQHASASRPDSSEGSLDITSEGSRFTKSIASQTRRATSRFDIRASSSSGNPISTFSNTLTESNKRGVLEHVAHLRADAIKHTLLRRSAPIRHRPTLALDRAVSGRWSS